MWNSIKALFAWLFGTTDPAPADTVTIEEFEAEKNRADKAEARAAELTDRLGRVIEEASGYEAQLLASQKIIDRYFT